MSRQPVPRSRMMLRFIYALACFISIRTLRLCPSRRIPTGLMQRPARGSSRAFSFELTSRSAQPSPVPRLGASRAATQPETRRGLLALRSRLLRFGRPGILLVNSRGFDQAIQPQARFGQGPLGSSISERPRP